MSVLDMSHEKCAFFFFLLINNILLSLYSKFFVPTVFNTVMQPCAMGNGPYDYTRRENPTRDTLEQ